MNFYVQSKVYITNEKRSSFLYALIVFFEIAIGIASVFSLFVYGLNPLNITFIMLIVVAAFYSGRFINPEEEYLPCMASIFLTSEKMEITLEPQMDNYTFEYKNIRSFKYSDKKQCIYIDGKFVEFTKKKKEKKNERFSLYVDYYNDFFMFEKLEELSNKKIEYIDRD